MTDIHGYWSGIFLAQAAFVLATLSPGPAMLSTMGTSMSAGRKAGISLGLGVVTGSFCWGILTALGLSVVIDTHADVINVIRILGGLYLLFLALKAFRSAASPRMLHTLPSEQTHPHVLGYFLRGWGIHMTNPKAVLAWIAIISLGFKPGAPFWVVAAILSGTMAFAIGFYTLCAIAFSAPAVARAYIRAARWIDAMLGTFFVFAALNLALR